MLCAICEKVPLEFFFGKSDAYTDDRIREQYFDHPISVAALRISAKAGCELCRLVNDSLVMFFRDSEGDTWSTCSSAGSLPGDETKIRVVASSEGTLSLVGMKGGIARRGALHFDMHETMRPIAQHAGNEACLKQLAAWINECATSHSLCRPLNSNDGEFLPTRLIDVGVSEGIRLVLTDRMSPKTLRYLALSHCWGNSMPKAATTTFDNLQSRLVDIPLQSLTRNFWDVCVLARKLGLRYVWIDSICIIQDSLEDWSRESESMGKVFSHSYCTIGAGLSRQISLMLWNARPADNSKSDGFLVNRDSKLTAMVTFDQQQPKIESQLLPKSGGLALDSGQVSSNDLQPARRVTLLPVLPSWNDSYDECPLRKRGWTVQERELSVRSVFYTEHQMIWECQYGRATEQLPTLTKYGGLQRRMFSTQDDEKSVSYNTWYDMVESYTLRELSFQMDRLPAISGLAEAFELTKGLKSYVAGLWEEDLLEGLLWCRSNSSFWGPHVVGDQSPVTQYRAPSWSWASIDNPIEWWSRHLIKNWEAHQNTKPQILSVTTIPDGLDPRGRLADGLLRIEGVLLSITIPKNEVFLTRDPKSQDGRDSGRVTWDHDTLRVSENEFFILPIYLAPPGGHIRHSLGLLLSSTGRAAAEFRRAGFVSHLPPELFSDLKRQVVTIT